MLPAFALPLGCLAITGYAVALFPRQQGGLWGGINITQEVLNVQSAISSPTCSANPNCTALNAEIPQCLLVHGDPACWCANPNPLHYCAICMSSPLDNTTTPQQTQLAETSHADYHIGCGAYFAFLNASLSSTSSALPSTTSMSTSTSSSASPSATLATANSGSGSNINSGSLAGIIVGGIVGLAIICCGAWLIYRYMQNTHERAIYDPSRTSYFGGGTTTLTSRGGNDDDPAKYAGTGAPTPSAMSETGGMPHTIPPLRQSTAGSSGYPSGHGGSPPPPFNQHTTAPQSHLSGYGVEPAPRESVITSSDYDATMLNNSNAGRGMYPNVGGPRR